MEATTVIIKVPFTHRHLHEEIKALGGRFQSITKTWTLPDNPEGRELARKVSLPIPAQTAPPAERVKNIALTAVELLNALRVGVFSVTESTESRIVIERNPSI